MSSESIWRISVYDVNTLTGTPRIQFGAVPVNTIQPGDIAGLESFTVDGAGDCKEAKFSGLASTLKIMPREIVQLEYANAPDGTFKPLYAGFVVKSGAQYKGNALSHYTLAGLKQLFYEIDTSSHQYAEGDVSDTASAVISDVIASGILGNTIVLDPSKIVRSEITLGLIRPNYRKVGDLLDDLAAAVPGCVWGIDANRRFFFGPSTIVQDIGKFGDVYEFLVTWKEIDASEVVSGVRWILGGGNTHKWNYTYAGQNGVPYNDSYEGNVHEPSGNVISYLSVNSELVNKYGLRVKQLTVPADIQWWEFIDPTNFSISGVPAGFQYFAEDYPASPAPTGRENTTTLVSDVVDGEEGTYYHVKNDPGFIGGTPDHLTIISVSESNEDIDGVFIKMTMNTSDYSVNERSANQDLKREMLFQHSVYPNEEFHDIALNQYYFMADQDKMPDGYRRTLNLQIRYLTDAKIYHFRPIRIRREALDILAYGVYKGPAQEAAELRINAIIDPTTHIRYETAEAGVLTSAATLFEYILTRQDYAITKVKVGQAYEADRLATNNLVNAKDRTITQVSLNYANKETVRKK